MIKRHNPILEFARQKKESLWNFYCRNLLLCFAWLAFWGDFIKGFTLTQKISIQWRAWSSVTLTNNNHFFLEVVIFRRPPFVLWRSLESCFFVVFVGFRERSCFSLVGCHTVTSKRSFPLSAILLSHGSNTVQCSCADISLPRGSFGWKQEDQ